MNLACNYHSLQFLLQGFQDNDAVYIICELIKPIQ